MMEKRLTATFFLGLALMFILVSCSKKKESNTTSGLYYYKATINGTAYSETESPDGQVIAFPGSNGSDNAVIFFTINSYRPNSTAITLSKGLLKNYSNATLADINAFLAPGNYSYSVAAQNGVEINWKDTNGTHWSTSKGNGDQSGSFFKITSAKEESDLRGLRNIKVKSTFNCKLYDDNGNMLTLTSGEMFNSFE